MRGPVALLALLALSSCGRSPEQLEMAAVLHAADALRDAPSEPRAARESLLAALERQPATTPLSAEAKSSCAQAYRLLLAASATEARLREQLAAGPAGSAALSDLADLASAESQLKESALAMPKCDTALASLRRAARYPR